MITKLLFFLLLAPSTTFAQADFQPAEQLYVKAKVVSITNERSDNFAGISRTVQDARLQVLSGPDEGIAITIENGILNDRPDMRLRAGETIIMQRLEQSTGEVQYLVREKYRLHQLLILTLAFFALGFLLGGKTGLTSLLGLAASIGIICFFIVPQIISGKNPLLISCIGAVFIACTSIYFAHGFNRRTSIALFSTSLTLLLSIGTAVLFVWFAKLFGMGTEESIFLQVGPLENVNLRGLLLGGIIIGALGVLDDITTAQTAAIDELSKANHKLGFADLYTSGSSIGKEHIASLINTLALAYAGASLPLLLLFFTGNDTPWWVTLNSEFLAEEIVRTLVGSTTLLMAVPISTWVAAKSFANGRHTNAKGHAHIH